MALIVEDGSGMNNATAYVDVGFVRAWAGARGHTLPAPDGDVERLILNAMDLVESFRNRYAGQKTSQEQALQWPRVNATIDGFSITDDTIPAELKCAVCQLCVDGQDVVLQPTGSGQEVLEETVDVLTVRYAERGSSTIQPVFTKAMSFLQPLFSDSRGYTLRTVRV